ncbi:tetratricopeptide repeat protein [Xanthobacter sp. TB0139]|uniref:tetratricopeptide repeat protein n=1 Tax=Xanthobacter sp. TB0139 TaxID=3459178 RepID=UPI0040390A17
MTDIFHEIEEDLRRERLRRLWDRFGLLIIALVVLIIAAAGAWSGYRYWQEQQAEEASARFGKAIQLADDGKYAKAQAIFDTIAADGPKGYRVIALFRAAGAAAAQDPAAGVKAFDAIAANARMDATIRDMALLRAAMLLVDNSDVADVRQRIGGLAQGTGPLRNSAREILALAELKAGNAGAANKLAAEIAEDAGSPAGIRSRADLIRRLTAPVLPVEPKSAEPAPAAQDATPPADAAEGQTAPPAAVTPSTTTETPASPETAPATAGEAAQ